jgi:hypothetical protein
MKWYKCYGGSTAIFYARETLYSGFVGLRLDVIWIASLDEYEIIYCDETLYMKFRIPRHTLPPTGSTTFRTVGNTATLEINGSVDPFRLDRYRSIVLGDEGPGDMRVWINVVKH